MACAAPVTVAEAPACGGGRYSVYADWHKGFLQMNGNRPWIRVEITGEDMEKIAYAYNHLPPLTDFRPEIIYSYVSRGISSTMIVLVADGCTLHSGEIPLPRFRAWMENTSGEPMPPPGSVEA